MFLFPLTTSLGIISLLLSQLSSWDLQKLSSVKGVHLDQHQTAWHSKALMFSLPDGSSHSR
uniref:Uncharacterized protein n=1 Tax=Anguilla anguilla TaxID=7936 RepID=A0A0E9TTW9_ANGAN